MVVFVVAGPVKQPRAPVPSVPPTAPPLILLRLRLETRGEHDAVERLLDLMRTAFTRENHRHRLEQCDGFDAPLPRPAAAMKVH